MRVYNIFLVVFFLFGLIHLNLAQVPGDKGAQGDKGDVGPAGPIGAPGAAGEKGRDGVTGDKGVAGDRGDGFSVLDFATCEAGWTLFDGHCYLVESSVTQPVEYFAAQTHCQDYGNSVAGTKPDLLSIDSQAEFEFLATIAPNPALAFNPFVGLKEDPAGTFTWEDGTSTVDSSWWCASFPSALGGAFAPFSCAQYSFTSNCLSNVDCSANPQIGQSYICEYALISTASGSLGVKGATGDKGDKGLQGSQGPAGNQGPDGDTGPVGNTGPDGPQGDKGDAGPVGGPGPQGDPGDKGIQGTDGPQGVQGPAGDPGDKGEAGDKGLVGDKGVVGIPGDKGVVGSKGNDGNKGERGVDGVKGETGIKGFVGDKGIVPPDLLQRIDNLAVLIDEGLAINIGQDDKLLNAFSIQKEFNIKVFQFLNHILKLLDQRLSQLN